MSIKDRITTSEILELLRGSDGDHTKFFYLYVSTAGKEHEKQGKQPLPVGQPTIDKYFSKDSKSKDKDGEQMETDDKDITENTNQPTTPPVEDNPPAAVGPSSLPEDKAREKAMEKVHSVIVPKVLHSRGWKKVYDKDTEIIYRALYFGTIPKRPNEDDTAHILRVGEIRDILKEEVDKLKDDKSINFKLNILLSRPLLYDPVTLRERSMREGSTQQSLDKYKR